MADRLPRWLYSSHEAGDVLRMQVFGSRRTVLYLVLLSARDGWRVWIWALFGGWSLTFGGEDPVAEGRISAAEVCPGHRYRILRRFTNGKVLELAYAPNPMGDKLRAALATPHHKQVEEDGWPEIWIQRGDPLAPETWAIWGSAENDAVPYEMDGCRRYVPAPTESSSGGEGT